MFQLALSPAQRDAYLAALTTSHRIRIQVTVRNRNEQPVANLEVPRVLAGEVQVDATADVSRSLSLTMLDPQHKLGFDGSSPADGALYADNFVSVRYGVETSLGWVDVPVFWGPVTGFERQGPEVRIEGQGKEALALDPHLVPNGYTIRKGQTIAKAIQAVMSRTGEQRYALGVVGGHLRKHLAVQPNVGPWQLVVGGAEDANGKPIPSLMAKATGNLRLFYDGTGTLTAKRKGGPSVFTFNRHVLEQPGFTYDVLAFRNRVRVKGGVPKHAKTNVVGVAKLPANHPLSGESLSRNGHPRYMTTTFESDSLRSKRACEHKAHQLLASLHNQGLEATFTCLPVPHLEELDPVRLEVSGYSFAFPLRSYTLPLTHDSAMSVGIATHTNLHKRRSR